MNPLLICLLTASFFLSSPVRAQTMNFPIPVDTDGAAVGMKRAEVESRLRPLAKDIEEIKTSKVSGAARVVAEATDIEHLRQI